ncbi:MAG: hypothetical protein Q8M99_10090 [Methylotenera sp.]|nr:hypothetical protein [Methylotenera sp.]
MKSSHALSYIITQSLRLKERGTGVELEMAMAIQRIVKLVESNPQTRWCRIPVKSYANLSWIVTSEITPVLNKIIINGQSASASLTMLNNISKAEDISHSEVIVRRLCLLADVVQKSALELLLEVLVILRTQNSPNSKQVEKKKTLISAYFVIVNL